MKGDILVRYAAAEEAAELGSIMARSFRAAFSGFISRETLEACAVEENCGALMAGIIGEGAMTVLSGFVDGKLMGLLVCSRQQEGWTEIEAIHSLPESWGTGLGAAMLQFALAESQVGGAVGLWAFAENKRARRFYEKHGFTFTGESRVSEFDGALEVRYERR